MVNRFVNLTASGQLLAGGGVIESMYVNSTSSGTMIIYHGTAAANTGRVISAGTLTPAAGFHYLGNLDATAGAYVELGGTIDVTFHIQER